jgi:hypothetical protein
MMAATYPVRTAFTDVPSTAKPVFGSTTDKSIPWCGSSDPWGGGENGLEIWSIIWFKAIPSNGEQRENVSVMVRVGRFVVGIAVGGVWVVRIDDAVVNCLEEIVGDVIGGGLEVTDKGILVCVLPIHP